MLFSFGYFFYCVNYCDTVIFIVAALIRQNAIEPCSVSRDLTCPACILWFAGRMLCSWAELGLILPLVWTWQSTTSPTLAFSLWLYLFGIGDSAAWEEPAFVRMSGVPWFRSYCHLLLFRRGGEGRMKVLLTASRHPLSLSLLSELC